MCRQRTGQAGLAQEKFFFLHSAVVFSSGDYIPNDDMAGEGARLCSTALSPFVLYFLFHATTKCRIFANVMRLQMWVSIDDWHENPEIVHTKLT